MVTPGSTFSPAQTLENNLKLDPNHSLVHPDAMVSPSLTFDAFIGFACLIACGAFGAIFSA